MTVYNMTAASGSGHYSSQGTEWFAAFGVPSPSTVRPRSPIRPTRSVTRTRVSCREGGRSICVGGTVWNWEYGNANDYSEKWAFGYTSRALNSPSLIR